MNDRQSNWLDMFRAVNMFYLANQAVIDAVPARTTAFAQHQTNITNIEIKAGLRSTTTTGITQDKRVLRINLENITYSIIQQVKAYTISINNNTLRAEMDFEISYVRAIKDDSLGPWAQQRLNTVNSIIAALAAYGITPVEAAQWQAAIDAFIPNISAPRSAQVTLSGHVNDLKNLFTLANKHLDETIDSLMNAFRVSSPSLFHNYTQSREIIDRGHGPGTGPNPGPGNPPVTGTVPAMQIVNVFGPANAQWVAGITIKIKNTTTSPAIGGLAFYPANTATEGYTTQGSILLPGQEETHVINAADFKPFLNIQNQGPTEQTYEVTIL